MIRSPRVVLHVLLIGSFLAWLACSGSPEPDSAAEAGSASAPPTTTPEPPPPPPRPEPELPEPLVILEDAREKQSPSLVEAARRERERRKSSDRPAIIITDENLAEHATGQVTVAENPETPEDEDALEAASEALELGEDEAYWRNGARERRLRLRRAVDEALALEEQVAGLRLRFYAEDDPYVRDSRIKPAWDRSLERLRQARQDVVSHQRDLQEFLELGHEAGALPGWLREAAELEPTEEEIQRATPTDPGNRHWPQGPNAVDPVDPDQEDDES